MNDDEIEEKLKGLSPEQLLETLGKLLQSYTLTYEQRQELLKLYTELKASIDKETRSNTEFYRDNWPEAVTKIHELLEIDSISEDEKERLRNISAMMSGYLLSFWLPKGIIRKILMFMSFLVGIIGTFQLSPWFLLFVFLGCCFSPRIIGEVSLFIGKLKAAQNQ